MLEGILARVQAEQRRRRECATVTERSEQIRFVMRITHLTLRNWRNFKQADFDLQDCMFVIGANAAGKSNLLDALRFLRQVALPGGGFQDAVAVHGGMSSVRCLATRNFNHGHVTMRIVIGDDDEPDRWTYELSFAAESRGRRRPILKSETVLKNGERILVRPTKEDRDDHDRMIRTVLERESANSQFREISDFLSSIRYLQIRPRLIRESGRRQNSLDESYSGDFLLRLARTPEQVRKLRLNKIGNALKAVIPQFDHLELVQDDIGDWHLEARYQHWRSRSKMQNEQKMSNGTLRLIALMWALMEAKDYEGPMLLEKPELSLHVSVVRQIPEIFTRLHMAEGPQVIATTQSDEILRDPFLGTDQVIVLVPGSEGTIAQLASSDREVLILREAGLDLTEILPPRTVPSEARQLGFQMELQ